MVSLGIIMALFVGAIFLARSNQAPASKENSSVDLGSILDKNSKVEVVRSGSTNDFAGSYKVIRVIDGDTIEIEGGERVRYIGMDTPETVDPRNPVQCFGKEASDRNKELVEGKTVRLVKDVSETDKYGRLLRYVYVGDEFINLELVKQGFAYSDTVPPDVKYQSLFIAAQKNARQAGVGLWSACPLR